MGRRKIHRAEQSCGHCHQPFTPRNGHQAFCSLACSNRSRRVHPAKATCKGCGRRYDVKCRNGEGQTYCSRDCAFAAKATHPSTPVRYNECRHCGKGFYRPRRAAHYCSEVCKRASHRLIYYRRYRQRWSARHCNECGAWFTPLSGSAYCAKLCRRRHFARRTRQQQRAAIRFATVEEVDALIVFDRDGWRCQLCRRRTLKSKRGTCHPRAPELDHIVPLSKGGEHSYRNTQCSCRECNGAKSNGPGGQLLLIGAHRPATGEGTSDPQGLIVP
jgi:hypothetical protein